MIKTILAVLGAIFVVFMLISVGAGIAMSNDCANESYTQYEWEQCMDEKVESYDN